MKEIHDIYSIRKKQEVMRDTWGHLKPKNDEIYIGYIIFAVSCFNSSESIIVDTYFGVPDSPWFYADIIEYVEENKPLKHGVYEFRGTYTVTKAENNRNYYEFDGNITKKVVV
mgnify:CR=1 FL=1|jgi:hypothetical protein|tara:strand:+ start:1967 stop:2305 length:339 start_codon:yes stop_codon:yes gene_type:complete